MKNSADQLPTEAPKTGLLNERLLPPEQEAVGSNPTGRTRTPLESATPSQPPSVDPAIQPHNPARSAHQLPTAGEPPLKIYLAARYTRRLELCEYRAELEALGHTVTSRWLNGSHQIDSAGKQLGDAGELAIESGDHCAAHFASEDVADVYAADLVIAFTEEPRSGHSRGGRHVELGLALAKGKNVFIVGPRENVFCWLPEVERFEDWNSCLEALQIPFFPWPRLDIGNAIDDLAAICHAANQLWWIDLETGQPKQRNVGELLMLCVSELAEAMEGHRKNLADDKLPHRPMFEVELADCLIRIFDLAAGMNLDLGGAFAEKMEYNRTRADHKIESRKAAGGKRY